MDLCKLSVILPKICRIYGSTLTRNLSNTSALITKVHRKNYLRSYPTVLVQSDGSTINIRYEEPRRIITLPLDLTTLSEEERKARIEKRKPKQKIRVEDDIKDGYNAQKYVRFVKRRTK